MQRLLLILFWSVIAAAFVGPGTVTTCARAGVDHGYALLWAVAFSTFTCLVLQEASARVAAVSGLDLGRALRVRFGGGARGILLLLLVLGAIVVGCAAYQAGNLLGAASGVALGLAGKGAGGASSSLIVLAAATLAGLLLWFARTVTVARLMGLVVAVMGASFVVTAALLAPAPGALLRGLLVPSVPRGGGLLVLGLIGTTVVPYNLFLGSGLARGQSLGELRFGLGVAVLLGGLISMAILVVGSAVPSPFDFGALASALSSRLGGWARWMFAIGLFSAGFTSAITAPLAAAMTARGLFADEGHGRWGERSWRWRSVWLGVLLTGVGFAIATFARGGGPAVPVQVIVLAQALNGVLLPLVAVFLIVVVNDRSLMGDRGVNGALSNTLMGLVVAVTVVLGASTVWRALERLLASLS